MKLSRGMVVLVTLDPTFGHEQQGVRPCVVVTDPEVLEDQSFPMLCVVPITRTRGEGALYPALIPGRSGLLVQSYALVDQVRSVDKRRVSRVYGRINQDELTMIEEGLRLFLGLR